MGVFSEDKRELTCVFNGKDKTDAQTLAYIKASDKNLNAIDISKTTLTGTQWAELAERLNKPIKSLLDDKALDDNINGFNANDCFTILRNNPSALNGAIIFTTDKAMQTKNPSAAQSFIGNDSSGISKPYNT